MSVCDVGGVCMMVGDVCMCLYVCVCCGRRCNMVCGCACVCVVVGGVWMCVCVCVCLCDHQLDSFVSNIFNTLKIICHVNSFL